VLNFLCPNLRKTVDGSLTRHCSYVHKFVWLAFLQCEDLCHTTSRFGNPITGIRQIRTNFTRPDIERIPSSPLADSIRALLNGSSPDLRLEFKQRAPSVPCLQRGPRESLGVAQDAGNRSWTLAAEFLSTPDVNMARRSAGMQHSSSE
jgi:hypothetical protein